MAGCEEACLSQIESAPHACLLQTIVTSWYAEKHCHYCDKAIGEIVWHERPPAVLLPDGTTAEWKDIAPERLPGVFAHGWPVCWGCHTIETFRREHPSMVIERVRMAVQTHTIAPTLNVY